MDTQSSFNYFLFYDKQCFPLGASGIQFLGIRVRSEFQLFLRDLAKFEHQTTASGQCVSPKSG